MPAGTRTWQTTVLNAYAGTRIRHSDLIGDMDRRRCPPMAIEVAWGFVNMQQAIKEVEDEAGGGYSVPCSTMLYANLAGGLFFSAINDVFQTVTTMPCVSGKSGLDAEEEQVCVASGKAASFCLLLWESPI